MRGLGLFVLVLIALSLFSFITFSVNNNYNTKKSSNFQFKTYTSAVCENKNNLLYCRDELFVNCNGKVSRAEEIKDCNGINLGSNKVTGFAVFEKG